jgi:CheY-like chemotaxis protein
VNPEVARHSPLILIVDNEQRNRDSLQIMLAAQGFEVQSAAGGEQGLAMILQDMPDLVLLDVIMAGGPGDGRLTVNPSKRRLSVSNLM